MTESDRVIQAKIAPYFRCKCQRHCTPGICKKLQESTNAYRVGKQK